jgi:poly(hydroxyalkanoate) depolymerase family esterase
MKLNEDMFAVMREATRLLQRRGPGPSTDAIQNTLRRLMPANVMNDAARRGEQAPVSRPMRDINPVPQHEPNGLDSANRFVGELLAGLGLPSSLDGAGFKLPAFAPQTGPEIQAEADGSQFRTGSFTNHAGTRSYKLYIPSGYHGQPLPLVVMLHGCTQNPDDFAAGTRMNAIAEEKQCFVVYPAQAQSANGSKCWNWFKAVDQKRDQGEPSIIAGITREIINTYDIDAGQVYIAGLSSGGAMAVIMGTTYPDLYAAVGIHSGLPYASAHDLPSALAAMKGGMQADGKRSMRAQQVQSHLKDIPVIVFHGDRDTTVHPRNAEQVITQVIPQKAGHGADTAHTGNKSGTVHKGRATDGHAYTRTVYEDNGGQAIAEHWLIHGAGHAWAGGSSNGSYTDAQGPDASVEMMRFFSTHSRKIEPVQ